jgi:hypothetical protein
MDSLLGSSIDTAELILTVDVLTGNHVNTSWVTADNAMVFMLHSMCMQNQPGHNLSCQCHYSIPASTCQPTQELQQQQILMARQQ